MNERLVRFLAWILVYAPIVTIAQYALGIPNSWQLGAYVGAIVFAICIANCVEDSVRQRQIRRRNLQ